MQDTHHKANVRMAIRVTVVLLVGLLLFLACVGSAIIAETGGSLAELF